MSKNTLIYIVIIILLLAAGGYVVFYDRTPIPSAPEENGAISNENNNTAQEQKKTEVIRMTENGFEPEEITIKKGMAIEWKNEDSRPRWPASNIHPTHGIYPEFDPLKPLESGESWTFMFNRAGSWKFHDHLIPRLRGVVEVTE